MLLIPGETRRLHCRRIAKAIHRAHLATIDAGQPRTFLIAVQRMAARAALLKQLLAHLRVIGCAAHRRCQHQDECDHCQ
jgi:hypothetical protein